MKIIIIADQSIPVHGGYDHAQPVNQQVFWLTKYLQEKHDVTLCCNMASSQAIKKRLETQFYDDKTAFGFYNGMEKVKLKVKEDLRANAEKLLSANPELKDLLAVREGIPADQPIEKEVEREVERLRIDWSEVDLIVDFSVEKWSHRLAVERGNKVLFVCHPQLHHYSSPPPIRFPCFTGVSHRHASSISNVLGMPAEVLPFGYELPTDSDPPKRDDKGYLLYFGRIVKERGCMNYSG